MLTHNDLDFPKLLNKSIEDLTKEEKEYISKFNSMKIPKQFYQYVVSYSEVYPISGNIETVDIFPTFGEAYDEVIKHFGTRKDSNFRYYIQESSKDTAQLDFHYDAFVFYAKDYSLFAHHKVCISRKLTTFWPETKFVTPYDIHNIHK